VPLYLLLVAGLPSAAGAMAILAFPSFRVRVAAASLAPSVFVLMYVLTCGVLSRFSRSAIKPGRMIRDLGHSAYGSRRLYGLCWTAVYYFTPLYHFVLALPALKTLTFRLFGYRGAVDFTIYPDTWIRDLPLLDIGSGAYVGNRATLGTNICLQSGDILVGRIKIGARAMIGHESIVGLGADIGSDAEVGVRSTLGMHVSIGSGTVIGALVGVNHGARIGADCEIESMSYIGRKAVIHDGIRIHYASVIPDRGVIRSQDDADRCAPSQRVWRSTGTRRESSRLIRPAMETNALAAVSTTFRFE
jgi:carbonic anhydrase/acetyltransferase-like protein (isoleucine patch superfamily)